jgi:glycosyltransferase involved in cell wall biosynthesis
MKVALLGPIAWRTPPLHYGPWELITSLLAEGLDSVTSASLDGVSPSGYEETPAIDGRVWEALHVSHALRRSGEFDLVHNHLDWLPLAFSPLCAAPMLTTVHGFSGPQILPAYARASSHFVSISDSDRSPALSYLATIHHGIDLSALPFPSSPVSPSLPSAASTPASSPPAHSTTASSAPASSPPAYSTPASSAPASSLPAYSTPASSPPPHPTPALRSADLGSSSGDLICFGRIHPDKGTDLAIEIARRAGRRLILCGIVQDQAFFDSLVAPHIDGDRVVYLGSVGPAQRGKVLGSGAALLHPIRFAEPFGLSVVEAMACGTPVIAYRKGSMPEVVDEGVTGRLVDNLDEAVAAVDTIAAIDRIACARRARERFSADRMVDDYLAIYRKIVS